MQYKIISAKEALGRGLYKSPQFILEAEPDSYANGFWLVPPRGYAMWGQNLGELLEEAALRVKANEKLIISWA